MEKLSRLLFTKYGSVLITVLLLTASSYGADTLTWVQQNSTIKQDLWSVYFIDTMSGWAAGNRATVVRTVDGGATWTPCTFSGTDTLYTIVFQDPAIGWTAGTQGRIYVSTDSGKTWTTQFTQPNTYLSKAWAFGTGTVLFAGATYYNRGTNNWCGAFFRTVNAGAAWNPTVFADLYSVGHMCFYSPSIGWAVGLDEVSKTLDSGRTWSTPIDPIISSYKGYVNEVWFIDSIKGFGAGRYGGIVTTADGGATWSAADTSNSAWLEDIRFSDPAHGVTAGERGAVTWSADSGRTWHLTHPRHLPTLDAPWFRSVFSVDNQHWWAAGDSGIIMRGAFTAPSRIDDRRIATKPAPQFLPIAIKSIGTGPVRLHGNYGVSPCFEIFRLDGTRIGHADARKKGGFLFVTMPATLPAGVHVLVAR
jgi:photosystem II stability/assembly factor-like uncharacterized protein